MSLDNIWFVAAIWMGLAFIASLISIRVGISVALIEILIGVIVGNIDFGGGQHLLKTTEWVNFLAMLGSGVLTFLAGAEIDPVSLRSNLRASLSIGFLVPAALWRRVGLRPIRARLAAGRISDHAHCSVLIVKFGPAVKGTSASPWNPHPSL